ncbi:ABC transporter permease [Candidatus Parabeggiatoa sp. HSG14]|uniref:ABC transporter permease n=1 Tax=Candidatus Parabeggiatoa sp. HSG14 TaxID=3055593 RepID=UPI0025A79798|nr:ABC transporter permease [Thiotrichales bacterium HSG14]
MSRQHFSKSTFRISLSQWIVLIQRNFQVVFADKLNLSLIILQVPLIALLIIGAFYNFDRDKQNFDETARILYYFGVMKEPLEDARKTVNIDKLHRHAKFLAQETIETSRLSYIEEKIRPYFEDRNVLLPNLTWNHLKEPIQPISDIASMRRGSVYFLLVAAGIWFGIMGSVKEIVTEQHILRRESRSYLFIFPYLSAKIFVLTIILGVQTGLLSIMVVPLLLELSWTHAVWIWLILWAAAFTSASMGLFISCVVSSYRVALTLVPLLMIPQLLFGGLLRPPVDLEQSKIWSHISNVLSAVTIQRWAFESILTTDVYAKGGILKLQVNPKGSGELDLVQAKNISLVSTFFRQRKWGDVDVGYLWPPLFYLFSVSFLFFILGYVALRWRFT